MSREIETKTVLQMPVGCVLKKDQKKQLSEHLLAVLEKEGILNARIKDFQYLEYRAAAEPLYIVIEILSTVADIATILIAIWTFIRELGKDYQKKEVRLKVNDFDLHIIGAMSREEIIEIMKEAKKIANSRR